MRVGELVGRAGIGRAGIGRAVMLLLLLMLLLCAADNGCGWGRQLGCSLEAATHHTHQLHDDRSQQPGMGLL